MKLIHCRYCHDVVRLISTRWRMCECKKSGGQYNDDFMSATIGGDCDIIGIPNPFFDEVYKYLQEGDGGKQWYRDKFGWGKQDIWYGGGPGDVQVCRIKSPRGPKLSMTVEILSDKQTKSIFTDKRDYLIDGKRLEFIITENNMKPSFKAPKKKKKKAITHKAVQAAMKMAAKDVRAPKVVRDGVVKPKKKKTNAKEK